MFSREYGALLGERLDELRVHLLGAPGQRPVLRDEFGAVPLDRLVVAPREILERIGAVGVHVDEVPRALLGPSDRAPEVRVDAVLDDRRLELVEERTNLRGQQRNGARHDELVGLEAPGGRGVGAAMMARISGRTMTRRMIFTIPPGCSFLSARRFRASHGSTSLRRLLAGVSSLGVSSSMGSSANRGSFSSRRNGSRPRQPLPMCSWRSTRLPHGFLESFRWNTLMRSSPTIRSNSRNVSS